MGCGDAGNDGGPMPFRDRREAGRRLAERVSGLRDSSPLVLGLPRGGVPVAYEVAEALGAPLDVLIVRKLGVPYQPELGMGAVGEDGVRVLNPDVLRHAGVSESQLAEVEARERTEVEERAVRLRSGRPPIPLLGRTVIIVDDGLATGGTARAAIRVARERGAERVVLAVPVAPGETVASLRRDADDGADRVGEEIDQEINEEVEIPAGPRRLPGRVTVPAGAVGLVAFAHGSGSGRHSPRNQAVARALN